MDYLESSNRLNPSWIINPLDGGIRFYLAFVGMWSSEEKEDK